MDDDNWRSQWYENIGDFETSAATLPAPSGLSVRPIRPVHEPGEGDL